MREILDLLIIAVEFMEREYCISYFFCIILDFETNVQSHVKDVYVVTDVQRRNKLPVFMADEECTLYGASVGVRVLSAQKLDVVVVIVVIDGTVECQHNHLWNLQA